MTDNTSGGGATAAVPPEIDKWNWGAFLLNWIWGLGNNTFIALLALVPLANLIIPFVLGAKGSAWAWRNKRWESVAQFKAVQRKWAIAGVVVWALFIALFVAMFFAISVAFKHTEAAQASLAAVRNNPQLAQLIGKPVSVGTPWGEISESAGKGDARLEIGVEGPNGKGTVHVQAKKEHGRWQIERMTLEEEGTGRETGLLP